LYLRAQGGRIPELKRVIAAQEGRVAMAETLDGALTGLLAGSGGTPAPSDVPEATAADTTAGATLGATAGAAASAPERIAQLVTQAREHYDRARAAQRSDDWATYGAEMRRLGEVLRQLDATRAPRRP
jgi:uncharacterized membrane protein (UPF0182 family)